MAISWLARALARAQVDTLTPGGTIEVGDIFIVTINGKSISYSATGTTVASVCTGLHALLAASTIPEFVEITWTDSTTHITATSATAGVCANDPGRLLGYAQDGDGSAPTTSQTPVSLPGSPISSFRVYDGHLFINTIGGQTRVLGAGGWNNPTTGSGTASGAGSLKTILWEEQ